MAGTYYNLATIGLLPNGETGTINPTAQAIQQNKELQAKIGALTSDPSKRDIAGGLIPDFYAGKISFEDLQAKIAGSPTYDPTKGPQIDYGSGPQALTSAQTQALAGGQSISQVAEMVKPTILSSANARTQSVTDQNIIKQGISNLQPTTAQPAGGSYSVVAGDTLSGIASKNGLTLQQLLDMNPQYKANPNLIRPGESVNLSGQTSGVLNVSTQNPALKNIIGEANKIIDSYVKMGGTITPEIQTSINNINNFETGKMQAIASGQSALDTQNPVAANKAATAVTDYEKKIQNELNAFQAKIKPLRDAYLKSLLPSAQVTDAQTRLKNLRASAQQSLLDTKGQPISMPFIAGQTAQQKEQFALDESNLLAELGLAKDAQTAIQKAAAGELDFAMQDYELATKVTDKLKANEDSLIERARKESTDAQNFYGNVAKNFGDFDITKNPEAVKELQRMAIDAGANPSLALEFAKGAWAETVADRAFKQQQEARLASTTGSSKPAIGAEKTALAFYNRAAEADKTASTYEGTYASQGALAQTQGEYAPSFLQSTEQQMYRQAQRAFTEARLRKESGAAIPEAEYQNDARTYFAQPGDNAETIAQKTRTRKTVLDGLKFQSGNAYQEYYGKPNVTNGPYANNPDPLGILK